METTPFALLRKKLALMKRLREAAVAEDARRQAERFFKNHPGDHPLLCDHGCIARLCSFCYSDVSRWIDF
jgi:hypothetical protein